MSRQRSIRPLQPLPAPHTHTQAERVKGVSLFYSSVELEQWTEMSWNNPSMHLNIKKLLLSMMALIELHCFSCKSTFMYFKNIWAPSHKGTSARKIKPPGTISRERASSRAKARGGEVTHSQNPHVESLRHGEKRTLSRQCVFSIATQQPDGTLALPTKKGCLFIHIHLYIAINSAIVEIVFKRAPLCWCSDRGILMLTLQCPRWCCKDVAPLLPLAVIWTPVRFQWQLAPIYVPSLP